MIGKTISHFEILAKLGGGGMGVVYRARDTKLGRLVALKFLPPHMADDPEAKARFIQEAEAASALDHANICTIFEIGEARLDEGGEAQLFIAMAFYDGQTLKYRLEDGHLPKEDSIRIARQITLGLKRAHEHGIVHRDIKPANIMVTDRGEVRILDFGLAKLTGRIDLTQSGSTLGTAAYMSPEQVRGEVVDHRSDIWAVGVVLYEMLTGSRPFEGEYHHAVSYKILHDEPPKLEDLDAGVRAVVERCLNKDPDGRFQSAGELADALEALGDTSKTVAAQVDDRAGSRQPNRWIAAALAVVLLVVVAFGFVYWPSGPFETAGETPQAGTSDPAPDRQRLIVLPFENLGAAEDDYFADGITEEITMRLASVSDLAVISRNTAVRYKDSDKTTSQIGDELDVDYVLEGTVRWAKQPDGSSIVRITPQLIRVTDDTHVWADSYEGSLERIFEIQKQVAGRVTEELSLTLGSSETEGGDVPTTNIEAYQTYLQALSKWRASYSHTELIEVVTLLEQAVDLDPLFLDASAFLVRVSGYLARRKIGDEWARYVEVSKRSLSQTASLAPGSAKTAVARGYYLYYVEADYEGARSAFRSALAQAPGLPEAKEALAVIEKRLGNYDASIQLWVELLSNDPMYAGGHAESYQVNEMARRYEDAFREGSQAIALRSSDGYSTCMKAGLAIQVDGNMSRARRFQQEARQAGQACARVEWYTRDFEGALAHYDTLEVPAGPIYAADFYKDVARFNRYANRREAELEAWRKVLAITDSFAVSMDQSDTWGDPEALFLGYRILAYAALGDRDAVLRAEDLFQTKLGHDKFRTDQHRESLSEAYIMLGMYDEALDLLEEDFDGPGSIWPLGLTTAVYDPIRMEPRFQALVARHPWP